MILVVYRPPMGHKRNFLQFLDTFFSFVGAKQYSCVILGDINIDLSSNDLHASELKTLLSTYNSENSIRMPTRITTQSATLLDVCVTNLEPHEFYSGVLSSDLSDHLPLFLLRYPKRKPGKTRMRCFIRVEKSLMKLCSALLV